jgi:hypothetical protein
MEAQDMSGQELTIGLNAELQEVVDALAAAGLEGEKI